MTKTDLAEGVEVVPEIADVTPRNVKASQRSRLMTPSAGMLKLRAMDLSRIAAAAGVAVSLGGNPLVVTRHSEMSPHGAIRRGAEHLVPMQFVGSRPEVKHPFAEKRRVTVLKAKNER